MGKYSLESYERYKMIRCRPESILSLPWISGRMNGRN